MLELRKCPYSAKDSKLHRSGNRCWHIDYRGLTVIQGIDVKAKAQACLEEIKKLPYWRTDPKDLKSNTYVAGEVQRIAETYDGTTYPYRLDRMDYPKGCVSAGSCPECKGDRISNGFRWVCERC